MPRQEYRPKGRGVSPRSVRVDEELWGKFVQRAEEEGQSASSAMYHLIEGFTLGAYQLPRTELVYPKN